MMSDDIAAVGSVGIVADDLTGANDSAVQFARDGWVARLALGDVANVRGASGSVIAIVTDARAQSPDAARAGTAGAVTALAAAGISRLFVKIDSTMRGTVTDQVHGALDAWGAQHPRAYAVACPAYPAMGRTVAAGRLLVDGVGVETTSVGRDPVTPVATSSLAELLPGSTNVSLDHVDAAALAARIAERAEAGARVVTVDAESEEHLSRIADAIALLGPRAVPVGSAGLAVEMSRVWGQGLSAPAASSGAPTERRRVVVVVSSLHDVSRGQHAHLVEAAATGALPEPVHTLAPTLDDMLGEGLPGFLDRELAHAALAAVIVVVAPEQRTGEPGASVDTDTAAVRIAAGLATIADAIMTHIGTGSLVLMGGEGARAVLDRFGAISILVRDSIREGIPIGTIEGGRLHGLPVVTKAGGFGMISSLTDIVPELLNDFPENTTQGESA